MCHVNERFNAEDWDRVIEYLREKPKEESEEEKEKRRKAYLEILEFAKQQVKW